MSLTQVVLRLARNPGFPAGDDSQGYVINAPLDADFKLSVEEWQKLRDECSVIRFKPGSCITTKCTRATTNRSIASAIMRSLLAATSQFMKVMDAT